MNDLAALKNALAVLDARVQALEAIQAQELKLKEDLRTKQLAIAAEEARLAASLYEGAAFDPATFRFRKMRIRKLSEDLKKFQPALAKAAIQRHAAQKRLKDASRQRLGLNLQLEKMLKIAPAFETEEDRALILYELRKLAQNAS